MADSKPSPAREESKLKKTTAASKPRAAAPSAPVQKKPDPVKPAPAAVEAPAKEEGSALPTHLYEVELRGGRVEYPKETFRAIDECEAIGLFVTKHGVRDSATYRRRVTRVADNAD